MSDSGQVVNGVTASNLELNGGIGYHQPSHYVKVETSLDGRGNTRVIECAHTMEEGQKLNGDSYNGSSSNNDDNHARNKNGVIFTQSRTCQRRWNFREKYLLTICILLLLACLTFVLLFYTREKPKTDCPCNGK